MRRRTASAAALLLSAAALASLAAPAAAKAPAQALTVEDIVVRARAAEEEARRKKDEAAKDPLKEAIELYRTGKTPITEYATLTRILNDAKDPAVQDHRIPAAEALVLRFQSPDVDRKDPAVLAVRREIATAIVDLMKAPSTDDRGLRAVESIFYAWWRDTIVNDLKFNHTDKPKDRATACAKMKKFLKTTKE